MSDCSFFKYFCDNSRSNGVPVDVLEALVGNYGKLICCQCYKKTSGMGHANKAFANVVL